MPHIEASHPLIILRDQRGLNQGDLAELMALDRPTVSKIENFKRSIKVTELARLIHALALTDAQAMALLHELAAAGAPAAEPPPATTPAPIPRPPQQEAA